MEKCNQFDAAAYAAGAELLEEILEILDIDGNDYARIDVAVWSPEIISSEPIAIIARVYDNRGELLDSNSVEREEMFGLPVHRFLQSFCECYTDSDLEREIGYAVELFGNIDVESLRSKIGEVLGR